MRNVKFENLRNDNALNHLRDMRQIELEQMVVYDNESGHSAVIVRIHEEILHFKTVSD